MEKQISQPLIININNKTENEMQDIVLFGASNIFNNLFLKKNNLIEGLEIESFTPYLRYSDVVLRTIIKPIEIQSMRFHFIEKTTDFNFFYVKKDIYGNSAEKNFKIDSKFQDGGLSEYIKEIEFSNENKLEIDAFTELTIPQLPPKSSIKIYIY